MIGDQVTFWRCFGTLFGQFAEIICGRGMLSAHVIPSTDGLVVVISWACRAGGHVYSNDHAFPKEEVLDQLGHRAAAQRVIEHWIDDMESRAAGEEEETHGGTRLLDVDPDHHESNGKL